MNTPANIPELPAEGVTTSVVRDILGPLPTPPKTKIAVVACGVKIHFPWKEACDRYKQAIDTVIGLVDPAAFEIVALDEPYEDADALMSAADKLLADGIAGIVFFHAAYTAGEIGSHFGRWLADRRLPVISWSFPDVQDGGRLRANSLCCQNFILGMWRRLDVRYAWCHGNPDDATVLDALGRFTRTVRARDRFLHGRVLHAGGSRVPAFYDGETDELAVMRRFGLRFDRVDLETVYQHGAKFSEADLRRVADSITKNERCAGVDLPEKQILQTLRFGLAVLDLGIRNRYLGCTVKSWPDLFDCYGCAIDGAVSMMNDYGFCTAEEGEMNGLISSLSMFLLSEGRAITTMMDLSALKAAENRIGIWHCGACPTRILKPGTKYRATKHSILENSDPETAVGLMLEFLLATGAATIVRYQSPDAGAMFAFEGELIDSPMPFRGAWCEMAPARPGNAGQIIGTILDLGLDHHWSLGYGHWIKDLNLLNLWLGVQTIGCRNETMAAGHSAA